MRCSRPSAMSTGPMLTTEHPMPLDDEMTMLLFSVIWNALSALGLPLDTDGLLRTRSSIVSGTESLMSLHRMSPSGEYRELVSRSLMSWFGDVALTSALVEQLHRVLGDGQKVTDVLVAREDLEDHSISIDELEKRV